MYKRNSMTLLATGGLGLVYLCGCECEETGDNTVTFYEKHLNQQRR